MVGQAAVVAERGAVGGLAGSEAAVVVAREAAVAVASWGVPGAARVVARAGAAKAVATREALEVADVRERGVLEAARVATKAVAVRARVETVGG